MNFELLNLSLGSEDGWTAYLQKKQQRQAAIESAPDLRQRLKKSGSASSASPPTSVPSSPSNSPRRSPKPPSRVPRDDFSVSSPRAVPQARLRSAEWHGESGYVPTHSAAPIPAVTSSNSIYPPLHLVPTGSITPRTPRTSTSRLALTSSSVAFPPLFPFESDAETTPQPTPQKKADGSSSDSDFLSDDDDDMPPSAAALAASQSPLIIAPRPVTPLPALLVLPPPAVAPTEPGAVADPDTDSLSDSTDDEASVKAESAQDGIPLYTDPKLNFDITLKDSDNPATLVDFVFVPLTLERMILFGVLLCMECFLFVLTALPLRCIFAIYTLIKHHRLHQIQAMDLVKLSILLTSSLLFHEGIDTMSLRSWIANQHYLKLHVFYTTLQLFDKLFVQYLSSVVAAMAWSLENIYRRRFALHWALAVFCIMLHACCLIGNVLVLDLAIYGQANSLFTVLILLQFTEIKSGVLKKMKPDKLFHLCCADVIDRFYLSLFLLLVFVFNVDARDWSALSHGQATEWIMSLLRALAIIYFSSIAVDWLKHMSITTFNGSLSPHIYTQFAGRFLNSVSSHSSVSFFADKSRSLSQDLGLFPLALSVAVIKIVGDWISTARGSFFLKTAATCVIWLSLFGLRVTNHYLLSTYLRKFSPFLDDPRVGILNKLLLIPPRDGARRRVSITLGTVLLIMVPMYLIYIGYCLMSDKQPWPLIRS